MRGTGFGTLVHLARKHGWKEPSRSRRRGYPAPALTWRTASYLPACSGTGCCTSTRQATGCCLTLSRAGYRPRRGKPIAQQKMYLRNCARRRRTLHDRGAGRPFVKRMTAHVRYTSKANNLRAMIEMAKSEPGTRRASREAEAAVSLASAWRARLPLAILEQASRQRHGRYPDPGFSCDAPPPDVRLGGEVLDHVGSQPSDTRGARSSGRL